MSANYGRRDLYAMDPTSSRPCIQVLSVCAYMQYAHSRKYMYVSTYNADFLKAGANVITTATYQAIFNTS